MNVQERITYFKERSKRADAVFDELLATHGKDLRRLAQFRASKTALRGEPHATEMKRRALVRQVSIIMQHFLGTKKEETVEYKHLFRPITEAGDVDLHGYVTAGGKKEDAVDLLTALRTLLEKSSKRMHAVTREKIMAGDARGETWERMNNPDRIHGLGGSFEAIFNRIDLALDVAKSLD